MKKYLLKVTTGPGNSFSCRRQSLAYFYDEMHYHPQLELNLIVKGKGTRFVSNKMERFSEGDLVLLGSNLPHVWKSDPEYFDRPDASACECITVHFSYDFLGKDFFDMPELLKIRQLLWKSAAGVKLTGALRYQVASLMTQMVEESQTKRLLTLLDLLRIMSISNEAEILTDARMASTQEPAYADRLQHVHRYIVQNFKDPISLDQIAQEANMSPAAFCRYFRQRTSKTFSHFLAEVRIGYACRLLQENKMKIAQVCYDSGFANLSNFNRQFKATMNMTPFEYSRSTRCA